MGLNRWDVYSLIFNASIGAGFMALPAAFQSSGVLASTLCLVIIGLLGWLLQMELVAITEGLSKEAAGNDLDQPLLKGKPTKYHWDFPEIVRKIMGPSHWVFYFLLFYLSLTVTLTAFSNITGTAFGTLVFQCDYQKAGVTPDCKEAYQYGLMVYFILVCCLTLFDYKEQSWLQSIMTYARFALIALIVCYAVFKGSFSDVILKTGVFNSVPNLATTFTILIYAGLYHTCLPTIIYATNISHEDHNAVAKAVASSVVGLYSFVGAIGLLLPDLPDNISLLFSADAHIFSSDHVPSFFQLLAFLIIFTPPVYVCTTSPLYCHNIAGMITTSVYGPNHTQVRSDHPLLYRGLRCLAVVPPVLLASFSHHLVTSNQGPVISFAGCIYIPMIVTYLPVCYNTAVDRLKLNIGFKGVETWNYFIAAGGIAFFIYETYSHICESYLD